VRTLGSLPPAFWRVVAGVGIGRSGVFIQLFPGYYLARALSLSALAVVAVV
jgi:hypothetical protein